MSHCQRFIVSWKTHSPRGVGGCEPPVGAWLKARRSEPEKCNSGNIVPQKDVESIRIDTYIELNSTHSSVFEYIYIYRLCICLFEVPDSYHMATGLHQNSC